LDEFRAVSERHVLCSSGCFMTTRVGGIDERTFNFACAVVSYTRTITWEPGINKVIEQLVDAAGSVGANRAESTAGTPREFVKSNRIALKEACESHFWLRLCEATRLGDIHRCRELVDEANQIKRILGAIVVKAKTNLRAKLQAPSEGASADRGRRL
jgi:four helix bundle protein